MLRDSTGFVLAMAQQGDVVQYRVANMTMYQVSHPDGVQHVLQDNHHNYDKNSVGMNLLRPVLGNGLFLSEGDFWLRQRRLMQPVFHRQRVAAFGEIMMAATEQMLDCWHGYAASGQPFDVADEMMRLTLAIVTQALFTQPVRDDSHAIGRALTFLVRDGAFRFRMPFYPPPQVPTPHNWQYRAALRSLDEVVYRLIAQRRTDFAAGEAPADLLTTLLEVRDADTGEGMSDRQLRDEVMTLLLAGHETTALALTWAFYLLATHPECAGRLRAELSQVLGGSRPSVAKAQALAYTRMVLNETLRLYPPAWVTNRRALNDDVVCGYRIPAGAMVAISPYATQHHPAFWPNPERFDPERFSPEQSAGRHHFAYFPFGGGPRLCIGRDFALLEAQLVLATVLQRYEVRLYRPRLVPVEPTMTLRARGGLPVTIGAV